MVNGANINLSLFEGEPPDCGTERDIDTVPIYSPKMVRAALSKVRTWTEKAGGDAAFYGLDDDLPDLIDAAVTRGVFKKAVWCRGNNPNHWVAADSYTVDFRHLSALYNRFETIKYYVKFAISRNGSLVLIVSCHD